jgi:mRNA interferase MazF
MLNVFKKDVNEENAKKDFKKLANYVKIAQGIRSIDNFAADCRVSGDYMESIIKARINSYPTMPTLKAISDNSQGRVTFKELTLACGYSNYVNNDMEQIKNIQVKRGWICFANYADRAMDSEVGGRRPVLVMQNNKGNAFSSNTIVLAITSRKKPSMPTHVLLEKKYGLQYDSTICCELPDTLTKRRLISNEGIIEKIAECPEHILKQVEVALNRAFGAIELYVNEQDAIESLMNLNKGKTRIHQYENNYKKSRQLAYA